MKAALTDNLPMDYWASRRGGQKLLRCQFSGRSYNPCFTELQ
jgi:hypothetical protein